MAKSKLLRMAGDRLKAAISGSPDKNPELLDYLGTFGFDALFGGLAAAQTPGDLGDKLIAGTTQAVGGGLGGVGLTAITGNTGKYRLITDMLGSVGGDMAGMAIGDNTMRLKDLVGGGKGQTPYEKMGEEQQAELASALKQQILSQYGLIPGTREQYAVDPSTGMGVS